MNRSSQIDCILNFICTFSIYSPFPQPVVQHSLHVGKPPNCSLKSNISHFSKEANWVLSWTRAVEIKHILNLTQCLIIFPVNFQRFGINQFQINTICNELWRGTARECLTTHILKIVHKAQNTWALFLIFKETQCKFPVMHLYLSYILVERIVRLFYISLSSPIMQCDFFSFPCYAVHIFNVTLHASAASSCR